MSEVSKKRLSPRSFFWAKNDATKKKKIEKYIAQAEFIRWPALQQSFENDLAQLNEQIAQKAKK